MPKLLAAKPYPALVDFYRYGSTQDPITLEILNGWEYENPQTFPCNFMSLKGHGEKFGVDYAESDTVKIEVDPKSAESIDLSMRFGSIRNRSDESEAYYGYVGDRVTDSPVEYYFNVDSMNPQVDNNGRVVCVEVYGKLA